MIQSLALRAPEVTISAYWDTKVDIWSLGCLVSIHSIRPNRGDAVFHLLIFNRLLSLSRG